MSAQTKLPFPWLFIAIAFGFNWLLLLPGLLASFGLFSLPFPVYALVALAQFGPSVAAFMLTYCKEGKTGMKRLFKRAFDLRVPLPWLAVALLTPLGLSAAALLIQFLVDGKLPALTLLSQPVAILPTFVMIFFLYGPFPEEFGWRGYLLDRLQARWSALTASLVLGVLWALWHLPAFFMQGVAQSNMPFGSYLIWATALCVLITWVYNNTNRSLFAAMLFHTAANFSQQIFPTLDLAPGGDQRAFYYLTALTILAAIAVTRIWGPRTLKRMGKSQRVELAAKEAALSQGD